MEVYKKAIDLEEQGKAFAIATVISSGGSTPRKSTAKMLIEEDGSITDTVGGGPVEKEVIQEALRAIKERESKLVSYKLNKEVEGGLNMNCGGNMQVFIEVIYPRPTVVLIGGGHVNYALSKLVDFLGFDLMVVDDRKEYCNEQRFPTAKKLMIVEDYTKELQELKLHKDHYVVIATKNDDGPSLGGVIRSGAGYIGMIGSKRKVKKILEDLLEKGYSQGELDKAHAPIGLDIGAETPEEIAISIMGELIKATKGGSGQSLVELRRF